jgi:hypothetical protein
MRYLQFTTPEKGLLNWSVVWIKPFRFGKKEKLRTRTGIKDTMCWSVFRVGVRKTLQHIRRSAPPVTLGNSNFTGTAAMRGLVNR